MNNLSRRDAIKAIGVGAPAAGFVTEKFKRDMAINPGIISGNVESPAEPSSDSPDKSTKFTNFTDWLKDVGQNELKNEAHYINGFEGDIIDMHLPMVTKIRMQRARNYERLLENKRHWFAKRLHTNGFVAWWP